MGPAVKYREVRRRLRRDGFVVVGMRGSHQQWAHPIRPGKITVAGADNDDIPVKIKRSIFRQARWRWE
jgi:predicted RNA binding protein YcfA (HicA-like mRNA interferase family)